MDCIESFGEKFYLSDEIYELTTDALVEYVPLYREFYRKGSRVRLISGMDGSDVPGRHWHPDYVTICHIGSDVPYFIGVFRHEIKLVS